VQAKLLQSVLSLYYIKKISLSLNINALGACLLKFNISGQILITMSPLDEQSNFLGVNFFLITAFDDTDDKSHLKVFKGI
jgi:hypothetical protein